MNDKVPNDQKPSGRLIHGLYAKDILLPWDDEDEFLTLHAELRAEFFPNGRSEEEVVLDLASLHWQKRTVMRLRKAELLKDPYTSDIVRTKKNPGPESEMACENRRERKRRRSTR